MKYNHLYQIEYFCNEKQKLIFSPKFKYDDYLVYKKGIDELKKAGKIHHRTHTKKVKRNEANEKE